MTQDPQPSFLHFPGPTAPHDFSGCCGAPDGARLPRGTEGLGEGADDLGVDLGVACCGMPASCRLLMNQPTQPS